MSDFLDTLSRTAPALLADGAMGTMLQQVGLPPATPSLYWSRARPEAVAAVHAAYVAAGSQLLLTNTLGAHSPLLSARDIEALNRAAVTVARRSGARWIAGSMGPGAGESQARALAEAGADLFWLETQLSLPETLASVRACRRVSMLPIVVTFSFHRPDGRTQDGEPAATVARALEEAGAAAIGLNCGEGLRGIGERLAEMAGACSLPLVAKPNAGLSPPGVEADPPERPAAQWAGELLKQLHPRVRWVGGCCGTTPAHIACLKEGLAGGDNGPRSEKSRP